MIHRYSTCINEICGRMACVDRREYTHTNKVQAQVIGELKANVRKLEKERDALIRSDDRFVNGKVSHLEKENSRLFKALRSIVADFPDTRAGLTAADALRELDGNKNDQD